MKQQDEKKNEIIRAGLKALYHKGYNATGVKEITDAAGIPKGSFYNYFDSKEDFAVQAMQYFTGKELVFMEKYLSDTTTPPLTRIENLYQAKVNHFVERGSFSLGCFLSNITLEMADVSKEIAESASELFYNEDRPLVDCLKEAYARGELNGSIDIKERTDLLRNSWLGALVMMKAEKSPEPLYSFQNQLRNIILK